MEQLFVDLEKKAIANPQRLVLPESLEPRTLEAADKVIAAGVSQVILIGDKDEIVGKAQEMGFSHIGDATFVNPADAQAMRNMRFFFRTFARRKE